MRNRQSFYFMTALLSGIIGYMLISSKGNQSLVLIHRQVPVEVKAAQPWKPADGGQQEVVSPRQTIPKFRLDPRAGKVLSQAPRFREGRLAEIGGNALSGYKKIVVSKKKGIALLQELRGGHSRLDHAHVIYEGAGLFFYKAEDVKHEPGQNLVVYNIQNESYGIWIGEIFVMSSVIPSIEDKWLDHFEKISETTVETIFHVREDVELEKAVESVEYLSLRFDTSIPIVYGRKHKQ